MCRYIFIFLVCLMVNTAIAQTKEKKFDPKFNIYGGVSFQEAIHLGASIGIKTQYGFSAGYIPGLERRAFAVSIKHDFFNFGKDDYHLNLIYIRLNAGIAQEREKNNNFYALLAGISIPFQSVQRFRLALETGIINIRNRQTIPGFGIKIHYAFYDMK